MNIINLIVRSDFRRMKVLHVLVRRGTHEVQTLTKVIKNNNTYCT